jgi:hypothetical protein
LIPGKTPTPGPDKDGKWKDKDGKWQDKDGHWHDKDGKWQDKNGHWHDKDGKWQDKDGHWHDKDGKWQDKDGHWHDKDGKWQDKDGHWHDKDGHWKDKYGHWKDKGDIHIWINLDFDPPPPSELGPPVIIRRRIPGRREIPRSEVSYLDEGYAPVPDNYSPPAEKAPVEVSPTALRAWNGQEDPEGAFDQTRVKVVPADDGSMSWQFYWKTTGPEAQAARWEVATVPFVAGFTDFPPAGLVGYGDASVDAESPLTENFFAVDFNALAQNFEEGSRPKKYYMRVVPVDLDGNPVGTASNFVRIDPP